MMIELKNEFEWHFILQMGYIIDEHEMVDLIFVQINSLDIVFPQLYFNDLYQFAPFISNFD